MHVKEWAAEQRRLRETSMRTMITRAAQIDAELEAEVEKVMSNRNLTSYDKKVSIDRITRKRSGV